MCAEWFLNILLTPLLHDTDRKLLYQLVIEHLWEMEMGATSCVRTSHTYMMVSEIRI